MVGPVNLIKVDVVSLQPAKRCLTRRHDLVAVNEAATTAHRRSEPSVSGASDFRRDRDALARLGRQPAPDDFFSQTDSLFARRDWIDLGCVKEVYAAMVRAVHDRVRSRLIALQTECH